MTIQGAATRWCGGLACALAPLLAVLLAASPALAASRRLADEPRKRICVLPPLALKPIYVTPQPPAPAADEDDDEDDEEDGEDEGEEDEDEEDEDEESLGGILTPDGTCIAITGGVNASFQLTRTRLPAGLSTRSIDIASYGVSGTFQIATLGRLPDGTELRTTFGFMIQPTGGSDPLADPTGFSLTDAWLGIGGWSAGFAASIFNFWSGDDFLFGKRIPARSGIMLSRKVQITERLSATLALENNRTVISSTAAPAPVLLKPPAGFRWPDLVARIAYGGEKLEGQVAAALVERRDPDGGRARLGKAVMAGARWNFDLLGKPQMLMAQISAAHDAPFYLGTQSDSRIIRRIVDASDSTRGFSAQVASTRYWSETISTNTYASVIRLEFPKLGANGAQADAWSGAANIIWQPGPGMRFGLEAGISRFKIRIPGRVIPSDLTGRQSSLILWVDRTF